ncbi:penicillin-binding protein [Pontibacillus chungwhensis BH030062]|uniref:Penicillin-binding protein n=1 Tax=Pontibacillus chungwhensis BH030062 TaxID=1385513 RepID=A0A0A2V2Q5_9BACI|nr:PBP1A family penicillin-binding protein [Pontibacillus chungwhensis]KGP93101.1 penicillin-binding protein [Pontibacillus chungwhensis BH030062]
MAENSQSRAARKKQQKQSKQSGKKSVFKRIFTTLLIIGLVGALLGGGLFVYYVQGAPNLDEAKLSDPYSTKLYDVNGDLFAELGTQKRTKITYEDVPQVLENAVLATEDVRFFDHFGIDLQRIGGAIYANITEGFGAQGASTITQQVVKRSFLSPKKSIERKVQEQWLALKLEQKYSKEQIFSMYLNKIYYGNNAYGVASAAKLYFNKDLNELTLPEAALLAGLPQRPSAYNPYKNPDLAQERKNVVLDLMVQHEKITEAEAKEAKSVKVQSMLSEKTETNIPYDAFIEQVLKEIQGKVDDVNVYEDGLKVYTTLDPKAQQKAEQLLDDNGGISFPDKELQAAAAVIDTKSGAIRAIAGGRNTEGINATFNYAIDGGSQPGSTFKPILDYGPAIEYLKWSTHHQLVDEEYYYQTEPDKQVRTPYTSGYKGQVSMRYALEKSLNVPAVKTLNEVGFDKAQSFAEGLGIEFTKPSFYETNAIGGGEEVTPLELAEAYSAFGNEGVHNESYSVTRIEFQDGSEPIEFKTKSNVAMNDSTAYMVTDMLRDVVTSGTGTAANIPGLPVAGKTGTTNDDTNSWFAGYTTNYTIAAWAGYGNNKRSIPKGYTNIPHNYFRQLMTHISQGVETADFKKPSSVVESKVEAGTSPAKLPSEYTPSNLIRYELFVKGTEPTNRSQAYDQLNPVEGLQANYDQGKQSITLSWKYKQDEKRPVTFTVKGATRGQSPQTITEGIKETKIQIPNVQPGEAYSFEVFAVSERNGANTSSPKPVQIEVPKKEDENVDDLLDGEEENEEKNQNENDQNENNNGNNNGNGNNQGNNGNGNNQDNNDAGNDNNNQDNDSNQDQEQEDNTDDQPDSEDQSSGDTNEEENDSEENNN